MEDTLSSRKFLAFLLGMWIVAIIPLFIALIQVIAALPRKGFPTNLYDTTLGWFFLPGSGLFITISIFGILIIVTAITGLISTQSFSTRQGKMHVLKKYLLAVRDEHKDPRPIKLAEQSVLISVTVPLNDIFIHLHAISDRPRHNLPSEQIKRLEELSKRTDLTPEQLEEKRKLHIIWYSQVGRRSDETYNQPNVTIEEALQQLTPEKPVIIILGAPGAGKSTTMRWMAYQMACACLLPWYFSYARFIHERFRFTQSSQITPASHQLLRALAPRQIPILIRVKDYVEALNKLATKQITFQQFFLKYFEDKFPSLSNLGEILLREFQYGNCLLLLDGLDEVASDELRRRIADNIYVFIADNRTEYPTTRRYNRFVITSRIVGYEAGDFDKYTHYTLQDLEETQIEQFLTNWYLQATLLVRGDRLTAEERNKAHHDSIVQRNHLLDTIRSNPGVKRLAINPLMLSILALLQFQSTTLPQRRIDLYQLITDTFIKNLSQSTERAAFSEEEIELIKTMLGCFAYQLHKHDLLLTKEKVLDIAGQVMKAAYHRPISLLEREEFIDRVSRTSGLFVESGLGIFGFMHRTFQEYFSALYLNQLPPDELDRFIRNNCYMPIWHEPLLLLVASWSKEGGDDKVSNLINTIVNVADTYDVILYRSLLLAANILVDCDALKIDRTLQKRIASDLFDIYGNIFGPSRNTSIASSIEKIALLWLRGQTEESNNILISLPVLVETWRDAICDATHPIRQHGAVRLFASIADLLVDGPEVVLYNLLPPLIQLTGLQHFPCPPQISRQFSQLDVQPSSLNVARYAFIALRLLDKDGPAGWLHKEWLQWDKDRPKLLERLMQHSLELNYLLTPAGFPARSESDHWRKRISISNEWKEAQMYPLRNLQVQLLSHSDASPYPMAYILKQVLEKDLSSQLGFWRDDWNKFLADEMICGNNATYQTCLYLRLFLYEKENRQHRQQIADELVNTITLPDHKQKAQALIAIANMFWRKVRSSRYLQEIQEPQLRELEDLLCIRDLLDIYNLYLAYLHKLRERRNLRYLREQKYLLVLKEILSLKSSNIRSLWNLRNIGSVFSLLDVSNQLDIHTIVRSLCDLLQQQIDEQSSTVLITLYSIIVTTPSIKPLYQEIRKSIEVFKNRANNSQLITRDHRLLIIMITPLIQPEKESQFTPKPSVLQGSPDELVTYIYRLNPNEMFTEQQVKKILMGCLDTRRLSLETQLQLYEKTSNYLDTVQAATWEILQQSFSIGPAAFALLLEYMDSDNAIICAAIARLLQHSRTLSEDERQKIAESIMRAILRDVSSLNLIQPLDYSNMWKLDDVLFEALRYLTV